MEEKMLTHRAIQHSEIGQARPAQAPKLEQSSQNNISVQNNVLLLHVHVFQENAVKVNSDVTLRQLHQLLLDPNQS